MHYRGINIREVEMNICKLASQINAYELGEMSEGEAIEFFQELVNTGIAWQLQGHYGRTAANLIEAGVIAPKVESP